MYATSPGTHDLGTDFCIYFYHWILMGVCRYRKNTCIQNDNPQKHRPPSSCVASRVPSKVWPMSGVLAANFIDVLAIPADVIPFRQQSGRTQDLSNQSHICAAMRPQRRRLAFHPTTGSSVTLARSSGKSCLSWGEHVQAFP